MAMEYMDTLAINTQAKEYTLAQEFQDRFVAKE